MRCWRVKLRRNFSLYLNGELSPQGVKRIEDHLLDCASCRALFAQLRSGHHFAARAPRITPERDGWLALEAAIDAEQTRRASNASAERAAGWRGVITHPSFVAAAILITLALAVLLIFSNRQSRDRDPRLMAGAFDLRDFHPVAISNIGRNTEPHVMAEGYVSEVFADNEDGDLTFKLVEDVQHAQPFIVCEIINPKGLPPPAVGSHVRVYGVSRYDNQADHNWYEVHPVLNIEVVRR